MCGSVKRVTLGALACLAPMVLFARVADDQAVLRMLRQRIDLEKRSAGIAVGIIDTNGTRAVAYGRSGNQARQQVDGDTLFEIGSITKVFTATLLADMVRRGEVALDDPIRKHLPTSLRLRAPGAGDITLRQLATHTSGLPRLPLDPKMGFSLLIEWRNPYRHYSRADLFAYLERCGVVPTGSNEMAYSNLGFGLLGEALACRAGRPYEQVLTERVLLPLGVSNTCIQVPAGRRAFLAEGHNQALDRVSHWDLPSQAGAGALRSSVNDMLHFLAANLNHTPPVDPMLHRVSTSDKPGGDVSVAVALGWMVLRDPVGDIVWHNGGTGGFRSFIGFDKEAGAGVVF